MATRSWAYYAAEAGIQANGEAELRALLKDAAQALKERTEDNRGEKDFFELMFALRDWPKLPSGYILHQLGGCASDDNYDWERGVAIQRELPMGRIAYTHECEKGAGFWDRLTQGAWRNVPHGNEEAAASDQSKDG